MKNYKIVAIHPNIEIHTIHMYGRIYKANSMVEISTVIRLEEKKSGIDGALGWFSWLRIQHLISAQVMIFVL